MFSREKTIELLGKAIDSCTVDIGCGRWITVSNMDNCGQAAVGLAYVIESAKLPEDFNGGEPWESWGGNEILSAAGLDNFDGIGETYTDKYGEDIYSDTALIAVSDDEI